MKLKLLPLATAIAVMLPCVAAGEDDVKPAATTYVSGRLVDPGGTPVANATAVLDPVGPGGGMSAMRTTKNGRYVFSAEMNRSYELHFAAPGFPILTVPVSVPTTATFFNLPDAVLRSGSAPAEPAASRVKEAIKRATLPADLLGNIRSRFNRRGLLEYCQREHGETLEQMIRITWLKLTADGSEQLLVGGLGPCLAGANNGPLLVYARLGGEWRRILDGIGNRLKTLSSRTNGFLDLARWQHGSAFDGTEFVYQFNGSEYKAVRCTDVESADPETGNPYPTPKQQPCTWDWKASER